MRINLLGCLISVLLLSGCATTTDNSLEIFRLKDRISALGDELQQKQKENLALKEKVAGLERLAEEKTILKMPTGTEIQTALKNAGFYQGKVDGQVGPNTKEAIKKFQEANELTPDGVVGSRTWELLRKYIKGKAVEEKSKQEESKQE